MTESQQITLLEAEVQQLRQRVLELEQQLKQERDENQDALTLLHKLEQAGMERGL